VNQDRELEHLRYIYDSIALIEARTKSGETAFTGDLDTQDAVLWRLQTLAEATTKLSTDLRTRHPEIQWRAIYGFRNIVAHGYLKLNLSDVWEIIEMHLPALKVVVAKELSRDA
jgi:uncharacterized protein with HEPN domain